MPSPRLTRIDETNIEDHSRLTSADEVYYLFEYTSGRNYSFSSTNNLISNLKKSPTQTHLLHHKRRAVQECVGHLRNALNPTWINGATLVPVPPSKARGTPEYDDRICQICRAIPASPVDVRELVYQRESMPAAHETPDARPSVADLLGVYEIDESLTAPTPARIGIVDDVLTAGTHYRAVHTLLVRRFPNVPIIGFFIARRVFPPPPITAPGSETS